MRCVLFLTALQGNDWAVTYTSSNVCALRGSTVDITCTYKYPYKMFSSTLVKTLWFTKGDKQPVDLLSDTDYAGRVGYICGGKSCSWFICKVKCTLRIRDLRQTDSAEYKFMFTTNRRGGKYTGDPGVTLSVADLQVKVIPSTTSSRLTLECHSAYGAADNQTFIWYKNGQSVRGVSTRSYSDFFKSEDSFSCAVEGHERFHSPLVCKSTPQYTDMMPDGMGISGKITTHAPKTPSVTASPSGEVVEGSSVTLSCSSDANPTANYTWFKVNTDHSSRDLNQGQQLVFGPIMSSDSGQYLCETKNELGTKSLSIYINVKYGPKNTSVISSPSGEVVEGSSVTLSCSSDANPAANYTWFKEHEDSVGESGQNHTITHITAQLGGNYYCQAHNAFGRHNSTFLFINVTETLSQTVIGVAVGTVAVLPLSVPVYDVLFLTNHTAPAAHQEPIEEQDDLHYSSIHISHSKNQEVPRGFAGCHVQSDQTDEFLYSLGNDDWTVTYTSSNVCALRGSTVDITCTYKYIYNIFSSTLVKTLWFTKGDHKQPVDLLSDADYAGRVENSCGENSCSWYICKVKCTLRIRDLRQTDSAEYKFMFTTNRPGGKYTGDPGVTLSVTDPDLQVKVIPSTTSSRLTLECHSAYGAADNQTFIWYKNGQSVKGVSTRSYSGFFKPEDSFSCAVEGHERFHSPLVCKSTPQYTDMMPDGMGISGTITTCILNAPKTPSVTVSPSGEVVEGSSVTLSCSSDANPAANYTWFKVNTDNSSRDLNQGQQLIFGPIMSSDSGQYLCEAKNELGTKSLSIYINVKYPPKTPSVTVSPSGEVVEGSSVTLSCSSDANPAANYTWFKEHEDSVGESGQNYTITNFTAQLGGNYYCQAHNAIGRHNSTFLFINVPGEIYSLPLPVFFDIDFSWHFFISVLFTRRKMAFRKASGLGGRPDTTEEPLSVPVYDNVLFLTNRTAPAAQREPIEDQDDLHYGSIHISHSKNQEVPRGSAGCRVQSDQTDEVLYSEMVTRQRWDNPQRCTAQSALQGNDWAVTYTSSNVCALRGSTVDITCTYKYPYKWFSSTLVETLWFTKVYHKQPVDLISDTDYAGRVEYSCGENSCSWSTCKVKCTLRIRDLRQTDSAEYKFRFTTNQPGGKYTGDPGVTLSVTDLQVKVIPSTTSSRLTLECHSAYGAAGKQTFIWYKNGQSVRGVSTRSYSDFFKSEDSFSCAVEGHERFHSPLVCKSTPQYTDMMPDGMGISGTITTCILNAPKTPSVTVSPSGEVVEGSSVTLSCSSDANPAANYTWFKVNTDHSFRDLNQGQQLVFGPIMSSDSGQYLCEAKNELGTKSLSISINVKYGPKNTSVISSPSGEVVEGSSVTLSCSSDANPAANYTWFKEHEDSVGESGQNYTITHITAQLGGNYYCQAHNAFGRHNSTFLFINVTETLSQTVIGVAVGTVAVLLTIIPLLIILWMRRKMASRKASGLGERPDAMEEPLSVPVYDVLFLTNHTAPAAHQEPIEEQDDLHYGSIHISHSKNQEVPRGFAGCRVESDQTDEFLYSLVNVISPKAEEKIDFTYHQPNGNMINAKTFLNMIYRVTEVHIFCLRFRDGDQTEVGQSSEMYSTVRSLTSSSGSRI
ncbi:Sialic acid-binding Ig-like lectin 5 [Merluccius polli]|uniref:B-cell receptor CD22 n=1 Tax=Merluccius polli TaxID=89951 RepID=A0AA47P225_MERPO|nr:Sialic acid-binding Ig-like lectin 5 [Merluccius polli]